MKREETYCDVCGKQMSYRDSDFDPCINGIEIESDSPKAGVKYKTNCGSSSNLSYMEGRQFCSFKCFEGRLTTFLNKVKKACCQMKPLEKETT